MDKHHEHHQHYALAVFATFAVTAIIVGVLVFQFQEKQFAERLTKTDAELKKAGEIVQELQTEKDGLSEKVDKVSEALSEISTDKTMITGGIELPLIRFKAQGLFTDEEINEIYEKLVEPYSLYYNLLSGPDPLATMSISKTDETSSFTYSVDAIHQTGTLGFIFGEKETALEFWRPTCMNECPYPEIFIEKYPELVETK